MKLYRQRPVAMTVQGDKQREEDCFNPTVAVMKNSIILANPESTLQHLDPEKAEDIRCLLRKFQEVFQDVPQRCVVASHDVVLLKDSTPIKQAPYRVNPTKREVIRQEVKFLIDHGLAEPSSSEWASPCLLVPKPDGTYRMCTDYRRVNQVSRSDSYPLPTIQGILDELGTSTYLTKLDLLKGYYQVGLTKEASKISAFVTPDGLYEYLVLPFGMKGAPATFQRIMNTVIRGLTNVRAYLDDLVIFDVNWSDHINNLEDLFTRLAEARLTVNLSKSSFGHATIDYLGHQVGQGKMAPLTAKVDAIIQIPPPTNRRELRRYLGMIGWYRRFCPNFAKIATPLTILVSPKCKFVWSPQCQESFSQLKNLLITKPVLKCPDFNRRFEVQVDASDAGAGAVLLQEADGEEKILHPVCYMSHKFKPHQRSYSTVEKELLALILALEKWDVYLGQAKPILVYSDHSPLQFLMRMKNKNQRLTRWALFLQKYDLTVKHISGKQNVMADMLSRRGGDKTGRQERIRQKTEEHYKKTEEHYKKTEEHYKKTKEHYKKTEEHKKEDRRTLQEDRRTLQEDRRTLQEDRRTQERRQKNTTRRQKNTRKKTEEHNTRRQKNTRKNREEHKTKTEEHYKKTGEHYKKTEEHYKKTEEHKKEDRRTRKNKEEHKTKNNIM
ncbi:hypothetical protein Pmani_002048 [Petrolisthes manimaculis]|uniref:RNA-directed DNA polymerase n=1 Tax=Petrolisthes manimaculis TaxID=1843537 RepID=A0AAE1QLS4_9EUCA|nr:hypothetical protein Pmani_002048 [Petrolisthes manimaculis]